jgi:hypothetical protein
MRERAAELGGWCHIEPTAAGGTLVSAWLPVHDPLPSAQDAELPLAPEGEL